MTPDELRQRLANLHQQLDAAPPMDEESRRLLRTLRDDIERALNQPGATLASEHRNRLEEAAARFEADHPALAGVLRQFVDVLGKAGL